MKTFTNRLLINAPIKDVLKFYFDPNNIRKLMPPGVMKFDKIEPIAEGSITSFTLWIGPLPISWVAVHTGIDPNKGFTDTQVEGPFSYWEHRHEFKEINISKTEVIDSIQAIPGSHPLWDIVSWLIWFSLPFLFAYRGWATKREIKRLSS